MDLFSGSINVTANGSISFFFLWMNDIPLYIYMLYLPYPVMDKGSVPGLGRSPGGGHDNSV